MDGENNGSKPYETWDDLGGNTPVFGNTIRHTKLKDALTHLIWRNPVPYLRLF